MKKVKISVLTALLATSTAMAQIVLPVPVQTAGPKDAQEKAVVRDGQKMISGVTEPSVEAYLPSAEKNVGTAVILCPGGAMRYLSWTNDVERMAKLLNARGVAAIGLKYRLYNQTTPPATKRSGEKKKKLDAGTAAARMPFRTYDVTEFLQFEHANANPMPSEEGDAANMRAVEDCRAAVKLVREHAAEWGIDPEKVGVLGFSAGGGVATGATITAREGEMPDFLVSVYGPSLMDVVVPENAPDLLVMSRAEHPNVAAGCLGLFLEWKKAGKNAELHLYGDGVGPFGLADRRGANTTDSWIDELMNWMAARRLIVDTKNYLQVENGGTFLDLENDRVTALLLFPGNQINFRTSQKQIDSNHTLLQKNVELGDDGIPCVLNSVEHKLLLPAVSNSGVHLNPESLVVFCQQALMKSLQTPHGDIGNFPEHIRPDSPVLLNFQQIVRIVHIKTEILGVRRFAVESIPV